jgi:hypothetical protein
MTARFHFFFRFTWKLVHPINGICMNLAHRDSLSRFKCKNPGRFPFPWTCPSCISLTISHHFRIFFIELHHHQASENSWKVSQDSTETYSQSMSKVWLPMSERTVTH